MNYKTLGDIIRSIAASSGKTEREVLHALDQAKGNDKAPNHPNFMKQVLESLPKQKFTHRFSRKLRHQNL